MGVCGLTLCWKWQITGGMILLGLSLHSVIVGFMLLLLLQISFILGL